MRFLDLTRDVEGEGKGQFAVNGGAGTMNEVRLDLSPIEENVVRCMDAMDKAQDQDLLNMNFCNAVQSLIEYRAERLRELTERQRTG